MRTILAMTKNTCTFLATVYILVASPALGADLKKEKLSSWQLENVVSNAIRNSDYYAARDGLIELVERKPDKVKYQIQLAFVYEKTRDYEQALKLFHDLHESFPNKYESVTFHLAKLHKVFGDYEAAMELFTSLKKDLNE